MRSDARRNRERVLAAARTLITERGSGVGMDEIAAEAGVAVGTLYRHFPTKTALVQAAVDDSVAQIAADTARSLDAIRSGVDAGTQFQQLFAAIAERHSTDLALKDAARGIGVLVPTDDLSASPETQQALALVVELLEHVVAAGAVRADTTVTDLMVLLDGVPPAHLGQAQRDRYVEVVLRGLMARDAEPQAPHVSSRGTYRGRGC